MSEATVPQKDKGKELDLPPLELIAPLTANFPVTQERRKLLAVLALPQSLIMSDTAICRHAGVDRKTYWRALKDPTFNALQVQVSRQLQASNALKYTHKYSEIALKGDRQALERLKEQVGTLDPPQRNVNLQGAIVNTTLTELKALIKEQRVEDKDINEIVEAIVVEQDGEGSTPDEEQVTGIPKENIGPSVSEKITKQEE